MTSEKKYWEIFGIEDKKVKEKKYWEIFGIEDKNKINTFK